MRKSKIIMIAAIFYLLVMTLSACQTRGKLLILNWGEYINDELVEAFEKETGYQVSISIADSNELFYSKIKSGTTVFDLVLPSDYMIEKMISKNLLEELDLTKLSNHPSQNDQIHFMEGAISIQKDMFDGKGEAYLSYAVPYFWGSFGLMYNKNKTGLEEAIKTYEWEAFFNHSLLPKDTKVGMYNVPRYAYATTMFYQELSPNKITKETLQLSEDILSNVKFDEWGFDTLKKGVVAGNLDVAFVYTGDFLDMLYTRLEDGYLLEDIHFDIHIPERTIAFMDGFVIPKASRNKALAYQFINFMLDPEHAYENARVVGYATPILEAYEKIIGEIDSNDPWLSAWAYANKKYYPIADENASSNYQGVPLTNFSQAWIDQINLMVNNVKTK